MLPPMNARTRRRESWASLTLLPCLLLPSLPSWALAQGPTPTPEPEPFPAPSGSAPARTPGDGPDTSAWVYAGAHFAGSQRERTADGSARDPLDPAFTLGARFELSTSPYLAVGLFLDYLSLQYVVDLPAPMGVRRDRVGVVGLGVWVKGSIPIRLGEKDASLYLGIPIGLGMALSGAETAAAPAFGLLFGALGGGHIHLTDHVGVFAEAGFRTDRFTLEDVRGVRVRLQFVQAVVHAGASLSF